MASGLSIPSSGAGLTLILHGAHHVPKLDIFDESDPYVVVDLISKTGECMATTQSGISYNNANPDWYETLQLISKTSSPNEWDVDSTTLKVTLWDKDRLKSDDYIGESSVSLRELVTHSKLTLLVCDAAGNAVLGSNPPHWPCEVTLSLSPSAVPSTWSRPEATASPDEVYPRHVFMMTRGTRGDVQPFVALARGMAQQRGWLVTICTELRWKSFVEGNASVSNGRIQFRPSGGDTEKRMSGMAGKLAVQSKTEVMQLAMMAFSEADFFSSTTVFISQVERMQQERTPVDLVVFGLTVAGIASVIGEYCKKPIAGFILQPSIIPSADADWVAVQAIDTHGLSFIDRLEASMFTSHDALNALKSLAERNPFLKSSVDKIRKSFGLQPLKHWEAFLRGGVPLVIPMRAGTFKRPSDWPATIQLTDFIFLRHHTPESSRTSQGLGMPLEGFVSSARAAGAKLALMTFSSMPVARRVVLQCAAKMVEDCRYNLRLIYVGKRQNDEVGAHLNRRAEALAAAGRLLEVERADFGVLFKHMDCFIVHGGLGTTVEALRMRKPCCVTGPLLLDQRFWGSVCHTQGVGPSPCHIDRFEEHCVEFVDGALDPEDPKGWRAKAQMGCWGEEEDDGVTANVNCFTELVEGGAAPWQHAGLKRAHDAEEPMYTKRFRS